MRTDRLSGVYVSTGAFQTQCLKTLLAEASAAGIERIELSSGLRYHPDTAALLNRYRNDFSFLIHNYFPPPAVGFTLNLASENPEVLDRSFALCRDALALCARLNVPFYSIHCGFAFDSDGAHLGRRDKVDLPRIPMDQALANFCHNLRRLLALCDAVGVPLAIENNVVDGQSLVDGENRLCLGADVKGLAAIFDAVNHEHLYLLLDLGHAKVNETTLGQPIEGLIDAFAGRTIAVHVSDNDGTMDTNLPLAPDSTLWPLLGRIDGIRVVESRCPDIETLLLQKAMIERGD